MSEEVERGQGGEAGSGGERTEQGKDRNRQTQRENRKKYGRKGKKAGGRKKGWVGRGRGGERGPHLHQAPRAQGAPTLTPRPALSQAGEGH